MIGFAHICIYWCQADSLNEDSDGYFYTGNDIKTDDWKEIKEIDAILQEPHTLAHQLLITK